MAYVPKNGLPFIEEEEATGEVAEIYEEMKREMQMPFVPNMMKVLAGSPEALTFSWKMVFASVQHRTLPDALISMISYTISTKSNCLYCSSGNELTCRMLGVDQDTLDKLVKDLENLNPERVQAIIDFALKVAEHPQELVRADYDKVRDQGVMDNEIVEIIVTAAAAVYADIVADALQIEVDGMTQMALEQMR
jgi:uncharacterized peroxidase-related enzyme